MDIILKNVRVNKKLDEDLMLKEFMLHIRRYDRSGMIMFDDIVVDNTINWNNEDIGSTLQLCLKCKNEDEARQLLDGYSKWCDTPEIARSNLGYIFGYCNAEDRKKLYSVFPVNHPAFGAVFGREADR